MSKIDPSSISVGKGPGQHCHKLIRATAIEMAGELYDELMANNEQYAEWRAMTPDRTAVEREILWIEAKWGELIEDARATLAMMLGQPINEALKSQIFQCLIDDAPLRAAREARRRAESLTRPHITIQ